MASNEKVKIEKSDFQVKVANKFPKQNIRDKLGIKVSSYTPRPTVDKTMFFGKKKKSMPFNDNNQKSQNSQAPLES